MLAPVDGAKDDEPGPATPRYWLKIGAARNSLEDRDVDTVEGVSASDSRRLLLGQRVAPIPVVDADVERRLEVLNPFPRHLRVALRIAERRVVAAAIALGVACEREHLERVGVEPGILAADHVDL